MQLLKQYLPAELSVRRSYICDNGFILIAQTFLSTLLCVNESTIIDPVVFDIAARDDVGLNAMTERAEMIARMTGHYVHMEPKEAKGVPWPVFADNIETYFSAKDSMHELINRHASDHKAS